MKEGFYYLYSPEEKEPVLVHGYNCTDLGGQFAFGYNTHDGGGLMPLFDLRDDIKIVPVDIEELVVECIKDRPGSLICGCPDCEKTKSKQGA